MRVLVATTWFPSDEHPGTAPFNVAHAHAIATLGEVRVAHLVFGGTAITRRTYEGLDVIDLPVNPRDPALTAQTYTILRTACAGADIVHTMAFSSIGAMAPLYPAIHAKWVHTEHWNGVTDPSSVGGLWEKAAWSRHILRLPCRIGAVTKQLAQAIEPFARKNSVDVIPCVIVNSFAAAAQPGWDPIKLVAVGALVDRKRPILAVDTVAALRDMGVKAHLTWVGDGPSRDEVEQHISDLGLEKNVTLVGLVPASAVAEHIRAANIFYIPTAQENFLTSAAEAIACGRPVVLPNTGGFTDYVNDKNGVIVTSDDPQPFAQAICDIREKFEKVDPASVRDTVMPQFSQSGVAQTFDAFYARTLAR